MVLAFHIDSGEVEGVDVSGLNVAMIGNTPRVMGDGNWRVGMFMDAAASKAQAGKLGAVFSGQLGGPIVWFAKMIGENLGAEVVPIEWADDGRRHRVRIGDFGEVEVEDFRAPNPNRYGLSLPERQSAGRARRSRIGTTPDPVGALCRSVVRSLSRSFPGGGQDRR